jgi:hypothetical protein
VTTVLPEARPCAMCGGTPARRYLNAPLCQLCAPLVPVAPPDSSAAALRPAHANLASPEPKRRHRSAADAAKSASIAYRRGPEPVVRRAPDTEQRAPMTADEPYVRPGATATSAAAAVKAFPRSGTQRRRILDALAEALPKAGGGATDPELCRHLALSPNSVRPRRGELVEMGLVEDSGRTRDHLGNGHTVWRPTAIALKMLGKA